MFFPYVNFRKYLAVEFETGPLRLAGQFRIVVRREQDNSVRLDTGWFNNTILDQGMNRVGNGNGTNVPGWQFFADRIMVGSGTTPPDVTQTSMANHIATSSTDSGLGYVEQLGAPSYGQRAVLSKRFAAGVGTGTWREIGVGWATNTPFARTLIVDSEGNPFDLVKGASDVVDTFYAIIYYPHLDDVEFTFNCSGTTHTGTSRASNIGVYGWSFFYCCNPFYTLSMQNGIGWGYSYGPGNTLGAVTSKPSGGVSGSLSEIWDYAWSFSASAYIPDSYYKDTTGGTGLTGGNLAGGFCGWMTLDFGGVTQQLWTPAIPKDSTKSINITKRMRWARYTG